MVEMVHSRVTAGETTVVSTAAVLEKIITLVLFLDSLFPKIKVMCEMLRIALYGELSLEEAMDLSQDRLLLDLTIKASHITATVSCKMIFPIWKCVIFFESYY
jgi:hypothetical protein